MEAEHKNLIKNSSETLTMSIDIEKLKPYLLSHKIFTSSMINDLNTVHDLLQELPTRGPKAFERFILVLIDSGYATEANILINADHNINLQDTYIIKSKPLGYCMIINNVEFAGLRRREGSDRDAEKLGAIFQKIGYSVENKRNLRAADMIEKLENFSKNDFSTVDSCIICILSHGNNVNNLDVMIGTDGKYVYKQRILSIFSNENCESLIGKPKVFFFVSCRGEIRDYGVAVAETKDGKSYKDTVIGAINTHSFDGPANSPVSYTREVFYPTFSDILIVHSTLPYNVSIRDETNGSWCIQEFVVALTNGYQGKDLETIISEASEKVMRRVSKFLHISQAFHIEKLGPSSKKIIFY